MLQFLTRALFLSSERPVHPDVRGALGGRGRLRLQHHGPDAGVSQLAIIHGLRAGRLLTSLREQDHHKKPKKKRQQTNKQKKNPCVNLLGSLISVLEENCKKKKKTPSALEWCLLQSRLYSNKKITSVYLVHKHTHTDTRLHSHVSTTAVESAEQLLGACCL